MTADEIIAVVTAHKEGLEIERKGYFTSWEPDAGLVWNFGEFDYRVKPEPPKPRHFWVSPINHYAYDFWSEGYIHVREVLP